MSTDTQDFGDALRESHPGEAEIRSQLELILASNEFRSSHRCKEFLRYVVEQTLAGHGEALKERTIGVEAFGRAADYETNLDGVVRIKASDVRKRLALYYAGSGKDAPVLIELPVGNYLPSFTTRDASGGMDQGAAAAQAEIAPDASAPSPRRRWIAPALIAAVTVAAVLFTANWWSTRRAPSVLNDFWEPMLSGPPVLIAAAYVPVFEPDARLLDNTGEMTLMSDQYVGGGDLVAAARVAGLLGRMGRASEVRVGSAISFQDMRDAPTVLIGYSSTQWKEMTQDFRFYMDDNDHGMIRDNGKPTEWYPHRLTREAHTDEDYAVVTRAFLPQTHAMLILISGCTQYGTEGAANLISNPEQLSAALREAPPGWQHKNLQLVLHMQVITNSPASPKVIAAHYW